MFQEREIICKNSESFKFSNSVLGRVKESAKTADSTLQLDSVTTEKQRNDLINYLKAKPNDYLKKIGMQKVDTKGVHDVVAGGQPIGDFYFSDMLAGLYDFKETDTVLDFGCSSGRVLRNLRSTYDFNAVGCDPRSASIEFNKENFKNIEWFVSNEFPPISNEKEYKFNMVFAISVWSHFSEASSLKWFDEFHKLMADNGKIIFSTHGTRSVYHFHNILKKMDENKASERLEVLRKGGIHFRPYPSGGELDNDNWGMTFISKNWLEEKLASKWKIDQHYPGMAMNNQDVYILTKL